MPSRRPSRVTPAPRAGPVPAGTRALWRRALAEDRVAEDRTTRALLPGRRRVVARIAAQAEGVLSGAAEVAALLRGEGLRVRALRSDGDRVAPGSVVLELRGDARVILGVERTALNLLMHLSGVATATRAAVEAARGSLEVRGTRKTLPGLRRLEKRAIEHGGGKGHRLDLAEAVLVKNNHLALVPIPAAVAALRRRYGGRERIEVEVRTWAEAEQAIRAGADELLLDNVSPAQGRALIRALRATPGGRRIPIELSGGITPATIGRYRSIGAQSASLGSLTHSALALPFHLTVAAARPGRSAVEKPPLGRGSKPIRATPG